METQHHLNFHFPVGIVTAVSFLLCFQYLPLSCLSLNTPPSLGALFKVERLFGLECQLMNLVAYVNE